MNTTPKSLNNAEEVIERFGGIRPMSTKTDIPVTTIQGWKKRNSIPDARVDDIIEAARKNDVDLSDLLKNGGANQNQNNVAAATPTKNESFKTTLSEAKPVDPQETETVTPQSNTPRTGPNSVNTVSTSPLDIDNRLAASEKRAVTKSALISILVVALMVGAMALLLWPKAKEVDERLDANGRKLSELEIQIQDDKSFLGGLMPESLKGQIPGIVKSVEDMRDQAVAAKEQLTAAMQEVKEMSQDVIGEGAGSIEQRLAKLEAHLGTMAASPQMSYFLEKIQGYQSTLSGQEMLGNASAELSALMTNFNQGPEQFGAYLDQARQQSAALSQTMGDLPAEDLKAAALLLTMNQFRGALNRGNENFESDLTLLKNFVGEDGMELHAALDRLAPKAQSGVLTLGGLTTEFREVAGEAVVSSLKGEDVNFKEKAMARMNDLFSVERDGELVTGTDTQAKLARTMDLLESGNLDLAISEAETLDGEAAQSVAPWLEEAKRTSAAKDVKSILDYNIDLQTLGMPSGDAGDKFGASNADALKGAMSGISTSGRMVEDPESGLRIYLPAKSVFSSPKMAAPKGMNTR